MFREMRRARQQLSDEEATRILATSMTGVLAVSGDDGYPYAVPLNYVYDDGHVYFHSAKEGHKVDAIRSCDKASLCVIAKDELVPGEFTTHFRSVIAFGRIRPIEDEDEKRRTCELIARQCSPHDDEGVAAELAKGLSRVLMLDFEIEHLTGKEAIELVRARANA